MKKHIKAVVERGDFNRLFETLSSNGYEIIGPTVRDNAVVYDKIESTEKLPIGIIEKQAGGNYRLEKNSRETLFGYVVGPQSWKKYLYPSYQELVKLTQKDRRFEAEQIEDNYSKTAFLGVRSCELEAIKIHDKVLGEREYTSSIYKKRRENTLIIGVNCARSGEMCFCTSMGTGPKLGDGFDLGITEIVNSREHYFVFEIATEKGAEVFHEIPNRQATESEITAEEKATEKAVSRMKKRLDISDIKSRLDQNFDNPYWEKIVERCLTCGNCTMVCPTCFCTNVEDDISLEGDEALRICCWDSCYNLDFSYIHGGSVRSSGYARYRQWLMHKLGYWHDQFGVSGCVGCGRCITWCPVGIDITEEAEKICKSG